MFPNLNPIRVQFSKIRKKEASGKMDNRIYYMSSSCESKPLMSLVSFVASSVRSSPTIKCPLLLLSLLCSPPRSHFRLFLNAIHEYEDTTSS